IVGRNGKTSDGIDLESVSWITLNGFNVDNTSGSGGIDRAGIRAVDANHVTIKNCTISRAGTWGIYTSHIDDVLIENNVTHDNNLLYNNHVKGITLYQVDAAAASSGNTIVNNTVVMAPGAWYALAIKNASTGNKVLDNILLSPSAGSMAVTPDSFSGLVSNNNALTN